VFLRGLQYKREEVAAVGVTITDRDYQHMVLCGIPEKLAEFASWLLTSRSSSNPMDTDALIGDICEEANHRKNRCGRDQQGKGKAEQQDQPGEALATTSSSGSHDGRRKRRPGNCHNCGRAGHWASVTHGFAVD
jgi:hypothetical protein